MEDKEIIEELFRIINSEDKSITEQQKMDTKTEITRKFQPLVWSICKSIMPYYEKNYQEIFQIGCLGLIKAINNYSIAKNVHFSTFATKCIKNEILLHYRKEKKLIKNISLNSIYSNKDHENSAELGNFFGYSPVAEAQEKLEDRECLEKIKLIAKEKLTKKEQKVFEMFYIDCLQCTEIAEKLKVSASAVYGTQHRLLTKLRQFLAEEHQPDDGV